jgi:SPP1 gp7 family putative phage head morphogenesis protein
VPSQLELAAARFRRELLNNERAAASAMVRMYGEAWRRTSQRAADVQAQIRAARLTGQPISPAWFYQQDRAETLKAQIEAELRRFAAHAEESTTALQRQAVTAAGGHAAGLVDLAAGVRPAGLEVPFDVLPTAALQDLVGFAADGSPLRDVFGEIAGVAERVTDTLGASLAAGLGPRETARLLRRQFGVGLARALTISRTETLRAYREAMHRNYEANDDVVEGWVWHATLTPRTCAACWAMHGTVHRLDERMDEHPNGKCTAVPVLKPWSELGVDLPDRRPVVASGEEEFAKLTAAEQERVLGKAAYEAWRAGAVKLGDFAGHKHDAEWGDTLRRRSLRDMVGRDAAARWVEKARLIALGEWRPA